MYSIEYPICIIRHTAHSKQIGRERLIVVLSRRVI